MDGRIIFAIVAGAITLLACLIHLGITDSFGEPVDWFTDEFGWAVILACLALFGVIFGFIFWIWWAMLIITVSVIATIIVCAVHANSQSSIDVMDWLTDDSGWIVLLMCLVLTGVLAGIVLGILFWLQNREDTEDEECEEDEESEEQKSNYDCPNCGSKIVRVVFYKADRKNSKYECRYCDTNFKKNQLVNDADSKSEKSLSTFEQEYFEACYIMALSPLEKHSKAMIERKYKKQEHKIEEGELVFHWDSIDCDEMLENAKEFFADFKEEIGAYLAESKKPETSEKWKHFVNNIGEDKDND
jgi:predicted RNA-binding Zn-ribbon protein involved in translation (DUF1610 family)